MKRKEIFDNIQALNSVSELKGVKFSYSVIKNKKKIEEEIKVLEEIIKPTNRYSAYESQRIQICEKHAEKDINNKAIIEDNKFKILDMTTFDIELNALKNDYLDDISEREKQIDEYNRMLDDDIELDYTKIGFNDFPNDITPKQLETISFMILLD
jgi:hypothetical protein